MAQSPPTELLDAERSLGPGGGIRSTTGPAVGTRSGKAPRSLHRELWHSGSARDLPPIWSADSLLDLQRTVGNRAVTELVARVASPVQRRSEPDGVDTGSASDTKTDAAPTTDVGSGGAPVGVAAPPPTSEPPPASPPSTPSAPPADNSAPAGPSTPGGGTAPGAVGSGTGSNQGGAAPGQTPMSAVGSPPSATDGQSAGVAPSPAPEPRPPTPEDPSSGIQWPKVGDNFTNARSVLEITRIVPGAGLVTGLWADVMNSMQDLEAIKGEDAPIFKAGLYLRGGLQIVNNGLGHLSYTLQILQDTLLLSVVGAEAVAFTTKANATVKRMKLVVGGAQAFVDTMLLAGAIYKRANADGASQTTWEGVMENYTANIMGDTVGLWLDYLDMASHGATHGETIKTITKSWVALAKQYNVDGLLISSALNQWNVWGGNVVKAAAEHTVDPKKREALIRRAGAEVILLELYQMKGVYEVGDTVLDAAGNHIKFQTELVSDALASVLGGKDPLIAAIGMGDHFLAKGDARIADLRSLAKSCRKAEKKARKMEGRCDRAIEAVDEFELLDFDIDAADFGSGHFADFAEGLADEAAQQAVKRVNSMIRRANRKIESLKEEATDALTEMRDKAIEAADFLEILQEQADKFADAGEVKMKDLRKKLARASSFEALVDMYIEEVSLAVAGIEGVKVEDVRNGWRAIGAKIDESIVWAEGLKRGGGTPVQRLADDDTAAEGTNLATPPSDDDVGPPRVPSTSTPLAQHVAAPGSRRAPATGAPGGVVVRSARSPSPSGASKSIDAAPRR